MKLKKDKKLKVTVQKATLKVTTTLFLPLTESQCDQIDAAFPRVEPVIEASLSEDGELGLYLQQVVIKHD